MSQVPSYQHHRVRMCYSLCVRCSSVPIFSELTPTHSSKLSSSVTSSGKPLSPRQTRPGFSVTFPHSIVPLSFITATQSVVSIPLVCLTFRPNTAGEQNPCLLCVKAGTQYLNKSTHCLYDTSLSYAPTGINF